MEKIYNICIHDDFGSISYDNDTKAENVNEAIKKLLKIINLESGDIIRIQEVIK